MDPIKVMMKHHDPPSAAVLYAFHHSPEKINRNFPIFAASTIKGDESADSQAQMSKNIPTNPDLQEAHYYPRPIIDSNTKLTPSQ